MPAETLEDLFPDCRILRPLRIFEGLTGLPHNGGPTRIAAVVDVETTGKDTKSDEVIELAMRRVRFDGLGRILRIDRGYSWRRQPSCALAPKIVGMTGIVDADLVGEEIGADAERMMLSADFIVAHNAAFDRKFVDRLMPALAEKTWLCSCVDIDWQAAGFDGSKLGHLLMQGGWFHGAHRALADVDALIALLRLHRPDGRTLLAELVECGSAQRVIVSATGARYAAKDALKRRGYRWNSESRIWETVVGEGSLAEERQWLMDQIYVGPHMTTRDRPTIRKLASHERFA